VVAWIGLVPKQHTTGGKDKLGSITKQGDRYLRWLLVAALSGHSAMSDLESGMRIKADVHRRL
jgi:transposase